MNLRISEFFGTDILHEETITRGIAGFPHSFNDDVTLDFSNCTLEYDATGMIIDHVFNNFEEAVETPRVKIIYDINYPEKHLLVWFFNETKLLGGARDLTHEDRRSLLDKTLKEKQATIEIEITNSTDDGGKNIAYVYGIEKNS